MASTIDTLLAQYKASGGTGVTVDQVKTAANSTPVPEGTVSGGKTFSGGSWVPTPVGSTPVPEGTVSGDKIFKSGTWVMNTPTQTGGSTGGGLASSVAGMMESALAGQGEYVENPEIAKLMETLKASGADFETLIGRVAGELGTSSSNINEVDRFIQDAIGSQEKFREANKNAAELEFAREGDYMLNKLEAGKTSLMEGGRGNAQQYYMMQLADKEIEKSIRDLESRKMQAIAEGDAKAFDTISQLQLKQLELRQNARDKYFEKLTATAGLIGQRANIVKDAISLMQGADKDKRDYLLDRARMNVNAAATIGDAMIEEAKLSAMQNKANEVDKYLSPGFYSAAIETQIGANAAEAMEKISNGLSTGSMSEQDAFSQLKLAVEQAITISGMRAEPGAIADKYHANIDPQTGEIISFNFGGYTLTPEGTIAGSGSFWDDMFSPDLSGVTNTMQSIFSSPGSMSVAPSGTDIGDPGWNVFDFGPWLQTVMGGSSMNPQIDSNGNLMSLGGNPVIEKKNR
jgi:hypothetical protein